MTRTGRANTVLVLASAVLLVAAVAVAQPLSVDVLLLVATPTKLPRIVSTKGGCEIKNQGPNPIKCGFGGNVDGGCPVYVDGGLALPRLVEASGTWSPPYPGTTPGCCQATVADQQAGAATAFSEAP